MGLNDAIKKTIENYGVNLFTAADIAEIIATYNLIESQSKENIRRRVKKWIEEAVDDGRIIVSSMSSSPGKPKIYKRISNVALEREPIGREKFRHHHVNQGD